MNTEADNSSGGQAPTRQPNSSSSRTHPIPIGAKLKFPDGSTGLFGGVLPSASYGTPQERITHLKQEHKFRNDAIRDFGPDLTDKNCTAKSFAAQTAACVAGPCWHPIADCKPRNYFGADLTARSMMADDDATRYDSVIRAFPEYVDESISQGWWIPPNRVTDRSSAIESFQARMSEKKTDLRERQSRYRVSQDTYTPATDYRGNTWLS